MSKVKESSDLSGTKKSDVADDFLSYFHMRSPLLGPTEFDVSLPPPPVDARFLDYDVNDEIVKYNLTVLELSERLTTYYEFDNGIADAFLETICYSGCGLGDHKLLESIENDIFRINLSDNAGVSGNSAAMHDAKIQARISDMLKETLNRPELLRIPSVVNKAKDGLPFNVKHLLMSSGESGFMDHYKSTAVFRQEASAPDAASGAIYSEESWHKMSIDERIEYYITQIKSTFVPHTELKHPINKNAKIAKCYRLMPNAGLWRNRYIQVGIDGMTSTVDGGAGQLAIGGFLSVAKDMQTSSTYEYYKSVNEDHEKAKTIQPNTQRRFSFVRQYSCQKSTKTTGNDNYYLLSLPKSLNSTIKSKLGQNRHPDLRKMDGLTESDPSVDDGCKEEDTDKDIHILPIKGRKIVLNRAGIVKRPDILITYMEDAASPNAEHSCKEDDK